MQSVGHSNYEFSGVFSSKTLVLVFIYEHCYPELDSRVERIGLAGFGFAP